MNIPKKVAVVGCGGIACFLTPMLSKLVPVVLIDADVYEPKNATRQFPALKSTGNKAEVLAALLREQTIQEVQAIPAFLKDTTILNHDEWQGVDMIVAAVDNNKSRRIIIQLGQDLDIPVISAANEDEHGEAVFSIPGIFDPLEHFPFEAGEPAPWSCNHDSTLESSPQTAVANMLAAASVMHLFSSWRRVSDPKHAIVYSRLEPLCGTVKRVRDFELEPA